MEILSWTALIGGGALAGAAVTGVLALPRHARALAVLVTASALGGSVWGLTGVALRAETPLVWLAGTALAVASTVVGYGLGAGILQSLPRSTHAPAPPAGDPSPKPIVVLLADVEPARYSMGDTSAVIRRLEGLDAATVPLVLVPLFFAAQRARYASVGDRSPARHTIAAVAMRLGSELETMGVPAPLTAFCDGDHRLDDVVSAAVARGARRVAIVRLAVGEDRGSDDAVERARRTVADVPDVGVALAPALWGSDAVASLVAERVLDACREVESTTGVVLVAHGQPPAWAQGWAAYDDQELSFAHRIRGHLVDAGVLSANVRVAWAGWREPDVTEATRHLVALGCARVLVSPCCDPVDCLETLIDLPNAVRMARAAVPTRVMPAWGDAPEVAAALARAAEEALAEFDDG